MKLSIIITFFLISFDINAQNLVKDQDLVTLKSGAQYLGYIIEQQPGKLIKMYRPSQNDTISINMEEVDKYTKIYVQAYASKTKTKSDSLLLSGRFNNKKNIYQFSFVYLIDNMRDLKINGYMGGGLAYYRSIKNRYFIGLSWAMAGNKDQNETRFDSTISTYGHESYRYGKYTRLNTFMFENKIRMGNFKKAQNIRLTGLLGVNVGYVFNPSGEYITKYNYAEKYFEEYRKETSNSFIFQLTYSLKINPDNNSGFIVEPGIAYYSPITKIYYSKYAITKQTPYAYYNGTVYARSEYNHIVRNEYLGYTKRVPLFLSFRLSYFF